MQAYRNTITELVHAVAPVETATSLDSTAVNQISINYPSDLFSYDSVAGRLDYNRYYAKQHNTTGTFSATYILKTTGTPFEMYYFYRHMAFINDTNNSTISDLDDSPITIDEPWVLFYLKNKDTLNYTMTKPSDEDIQAERERIILE